MSHDLLVTGATVVTPQGLTQSDILIDEGRIVGLVPRGEAEADRVIDAKGLHAFPGLIDAHVHFGFVEPVT